jgi:hypothetical protein
MEVHPPFTATPICRRAGARAVWPRNGERRNQSRRRRKQPPPSGELPHPCMCFYMQNCPQGCDHSQDGGAGWQRKEHGGPTALVSSLRSPLPRQHYLLIIPGCDFGPSLQSPSPQARHLLTAAIPNWGRCANGRVDRGEGMAGATTAPGAAPASFRLFAGAQATVDLGKGYAEASSYV